MTHGLDRLGMTTSALCAVHCAAVPLLLTMLPLWGLGFLARPWVELLMISLAVLLGITSLGLSYFRYHRNPLPLIVLVIGFGLIALGHLTGHVHPHYPEFYDYGQQPYSQILAVSLKGNITPHRHHAFLEIWTVPAGGLAIAAAHFLNWHFTRKYHQCAHPH